MSDTLMTIIGVFIAVILMIVFPLIEFAQKNDEISQTTVHMAVSDFVNTVTTNGKITQFDYDKLITKIYATGNSYDIQIEAQIIDDNPRRATTTGEKEVLGQYKYYSVYTSTILDKLRKGEDYELKDDDYITVTVKNTNLTIATQLKNMFYKLTGKDTYSIGTSVSSIVLNGSSAEVEPESQLKNIAILTPEIPPTPPPTEPPTPELPPEPPEPPTLQEKTVNVKTTKRVETRVPLKNNAEVVVVLDYESDTMPHHNEGGNAYPSTTFIGEIRQVAAETGVDLYFVSTNTATQGVDFNTTFMSRPVSGDMYQASIRKAISLFSGTKPRVIVMLSYRPDYENILESIDELNNNKDKYDALYGTFCCHPKGSWSEWSWRAAHWSGTLSDDESMESRFFSLLYFDSIKKYTDTTNNKNVTTMDLKIDLDNLDTSKEVTVKFNGRTYNVGGVNTIVYQSGGKYILDFGAFISTYSISTETWNSKSVVVNYSER